MNRDELLKILQDETDGFTEQSRLRDDVLDALEKVQELAINYSQCCKSDSELLPKRLSNEAYKKAQIMSYAGFVEWWDEQQV